MTLETWVETPLAAAVGWTLLHSLWEGTLIAAALALALVILRSPRARYAAASFALLAVLLTFGLTLARALPEGAIHAHAARPRAFPAWNIAPDAGAGGASHSSLALIVPWLAPFWIAGVLAYYLAHLAGWMAVRRMRRRGVCAASERWQNELSRLRARLRVSRPVLLLESCMADVPMVLGHFRPLILAPVGLLAGLPSAQVEAILLHELAHIRRCDYLLNVLQRSIEGLLFYHPAVWWISRVIRAEREDCCDDLVVQTTGNAQAYAFALAALEESRPSGRLPAVAATGGSLVKRIRRILYPKAPSGAVNPLLAAAILVATAAVAFAAWQSKATGQNPAGAQAQTENLSSPYHKWLDEDVVYIITDEERAAFLELTTDEERDKFIEQFWLRRDPAPGTGRNEFKEEHYRRVAYANGRFASARPGWQTDRGHMYIVYGPPDEIESHPGSAKNQFAYEIWMYRHVEGIGERATVTFVDRAGSGDYRLAPGTGK